MLSHESEALTFIGAWQNDKKYDRTEILHIAKTQPKQAWPTTTLPKLSRTLARSWPTLNASFFTPFFALTFAGVGWFQRPELLLLETSAVCVQFVSEGFGCHVLVLAVDEPDRPPALLLVLGQNITVRVDFIA